MRRVHQSPLGLIPGQHASRLHDRVVELLRTRHYSRRTEATHLLEDGNDIRTVQELLRHKDVQTTMVNTHLLNRGGRGVRSGIIPDWRVGLKLGGSYWTRKKSLQTESLPPGLATSGFVLGCPGPVLSSSA